MHPFNLTEVIMNRTLLAVAASALMMTGCATIPATRPEYVGLKPLESGWSRIYVSAGSMSGIRLRSIEQVGPVFINNKRVGSTAKDEHFIVDLLPGTYEAYCTPEQPYKTFIEKHQFTFNAGETRYFSCDMASKGSGMSFGLIGVLASEYLYKSYLEERPLDNPNSKLVSYEKLQ